MSHKEKVADRYDRWSRFYDIVDNFPVVSRPQRNWKRSAVDALDMKGDELVLDVGTGSGQILPWIASELDEGLVIGTDISPKMVNYANDVLKKEGLDDRAKAVYDDIEASKFPDEHFDKIVSTFTFTTVPDPEKAASECARILKPDGRMIVIDTGKPTNKLAMPLFLPMMLSAKAFGRTHMDRDIIGTLGDYFHVEVTERYMMNMVYIAQCR
ncbi:MAG: methyltransferase domain-containing protein [Thermoplasmata archaeon]